MLICLAQVVGHIITQVFLPKCYITQYASWFAEAQEGALNIGFFDMAFDIVGLDIESGARWLGQINNC